MTAAAGERLEFKTELKQLLHLITHSLYSNREIFLRELISNASDAINKLRFDALSHEDLLEGDADWKVVITPDKAAGTLTIGDNGVGLSRQTAVENLGTIAKSGTRVFLEAVKAQQGPARPDLIGQFGVGFYSAFMVADKVTVVSRPAGDPEGGVRWESDGQGEYTVEAADRDKRGTDVILHLKADAKEFLDEWRLRSLVKKFSDFIEHPVVLVAERTTGEGDDKKTETVEETLNARKAVWLRNKSEVTPEEYNEFYRQVAHDSNDPARVIHYTAEGVNEFRVLMFVPAKKPWTFQFEDPKPGLRLYVQRVLIMENCEELLPSYLRFVRGVVDSSDLPLNISRELLQENPLLERIGKNLVGNVLKELAAFRDADRAKYVEFFKGLGSILKEGAARDWANREKVADLLLFESMATPAGEFTTLAKYVEAMPEGQKEIYYLTGETREGLEHSPLLEAFRKRGHDVLLLTDPVDEFVIPQMNEYKGKKFRPIDRGDLPDAGDEPKPDAERFQTLFAFLKGKLTEVTEVRLSKRLTDSAACLVADGGAMGANYERIMRKFGQLGEDEGAKRSLELNGDHPAVKAVLALYEKDPQDARVEDYARLLYDQAVIAEGSKVKDPQAFARRVNALLTKDAGV